MTSTRVGLGLACVAFLALLGWNLRMQSELASLRATTAQQEQALQLAEARSERRPEGPRAERRRARPPAGGAPWGTPADPSPQADPPTEGEAATAEEGQREEPDWQAIRAEMEAHTVDTVEAFGTQHGWPVETTEEVLAILLESGDQIGAVWTAVHDGESTHYRARREMMEIRTAAGDDIAALVGAEAHEALEEHLFEARREAWRSAGRSRGGHH